MYVRKILVINIQDLLKYGYLKSTMQGFVPYLALYLQISLKVYQWKGFCTDNYINQCPRVTYPPGFLKKIVLVEKFDFTFNMLMKKWYDMVLYKDVEIWHVWSSFINLKAHYYSWFMPTLTHCRSFSLNFEVL